LRRDDASRRDKPSSGPGASRYAGEDFKAFSGAVQELNTLRRPRDWGRLLLVAGRRRKVVWRGVRVVRQLQELELPLTSAEAGESIRRTLKSRPSRVARSVLQLPDDRARYLRGRHRQALRTNVRHADALGISCHEVHETGAKEAALDDLLRGLGLGHPNTLEERRYLNQVIGLEPERQQVYTAVDADGKVVGFAAVEVDLRCARLVFLHSIAGPMCAPARYALSLHVIGALIDARVDLLLVGGTMRLAPGLQYFQQRLGFEIFNVRPVPVAQEWTGRRSRFGRAVSRERAPAPHRSA
jgi:hypothetical protein